MLIRCPHCLYSRQLAPEQLPPGITRATCPKCGLSFALSLDDAEPPEVAQNSVVPVPAEADETASEPVGQNQDLAASLPKAGFWIRVVATLIDVLLVFILQFVLGLALALTGFVVIDGPQQLSGLLMLFGYAISFAYYIVFTGHGGQTPGKMALRIKVIRCSGTDIGYGRAALREVVGKFISGIIFCIGYLMVAFDEQKQGLHDRLADTYVIKL